MYTLHLLGQRRENWKTLSLRNQTITPFDSPSKRRMIMRDGVFEKKLSAKICTLPLFPQAKRDVSENDNKNHTYTKWNFRKVHSMLMNIMSFMI